MLDDALLRSPKVALGNSDLRRGIVLAGAAEQMFFFGAPLAHVVAFEQWQRDQRLQQTYRRQRRSTPPRLLNLVTLPSGESA